MKIRPSTLGDREAIIALWERVLPANAPHNDPAKSFDAKFAMGDDLLFVATDSGTVIGTAMAGYDGHRGGCIRSPSCRSIDGAESARTSFSAQSVHCER